jgi:hypothetical protein
MIAMLVLLIGMAGFAALQPVAVRANHFAKRTAVASMLATDMVETIHQWGYSDSRLAPSQTIQNCNTVSVTDGGASGGCFAVTAVTSTWDLGKSAAGSYVPQFSEGSLGTFQGLPADVDRDGASEFTRYWNVYAVDPQSTGTPIGVMVQIVVRWKEPAFGYRQITTSTFKANPAAALQ